MRGLASPPGCAPIGPLATPRDPRARLCPQAGRTDASPVRPARATPVIEACAAARFSPKADGRARCATAEARLRRRVLHGSAFRHVRRNHAARLCDAFPQVRLLMAAASPCATPPAGVPASSRRECGTCAIRAEARAVFRPASRREAPADASRRGLGGEHAGRRSRQAAHGRRRASQVQRVRPQRKARRVPRRNGCSPKAAPRRLDWRPLPGLADNGMRHFHGA